MGDKITALTELAATPANGDFIPIVDVSDPGTGTTKKITRANLVAGLGVIVEEQDGTPSVAAVKIKFPNGKVTDDGAGVVSIAVGGDVVDDATPQLGGNLDMNDRHIVLKTPTADVTGMGIIRTLTVDTNAEGIGAPLFMAADGHLDTADADAVASMPCVALALETSTGAKKVLLWGTIRNDAWNWTIGPGELSLIYVSTTVGTLTQTKPTGVDDVVQPVGWAISADEIMFMPSMMWITHTG